MMKKPEIKDTSFDVNPIGFDNRIDYASLYHMYMNKLNEIHAYGSLRDAISYFNTMVVPTFMGMMDLEFIINCKKISDSNFDYKKSYMLHRVEFGRLMTRIGIAPKPDIRIRYKANWKVPKEIKGMSYDGKDKKEE